MLLVLDCNYICWCHAYAIGQGLSFAGQRTEVIYGFLKQLLYLSEKFEPNQIAFCWDSVENKRKELSPDYKKKSPLSSEEAEALNLIFDQFEQLRKDILPYLGFVNVFRVTGYEADDLMAKLVMNYKKENGPVIIVSRDKDLYQLLDYCTLYSVTGRQTTTKEEFVKKYNIEPSQWAEVKAMAGCSSDKVKGIFGIGDKTAAGYLAKTINKGKAFLKIKDSQAIIDKNLPLVKLPFEGTPTPKLKKDNITRGESYGLWKEVCKHYGFSSLMDTESVEIWKTLVKKLSE